MIASILAPVEYRDFGRTGVKVSPLCLGAMMFGLKTPEADSIGMIERALERGINFIDTANVYAGGESERIVGRALAKNGRRARTVLATKVHFRTAPDDPNAMGNSRRNIIAECENSLRRLQTDWIDLYQLHRSQAQVPIDETLRALDDLIRAGKVRYAGTSLFPAWQLVESLWASRELGLHRFVSEQPAYSLLDRTIERELVPAAQTFSVALIPWSPLAGGLLTGKYARDSTPSDGRWASGRDFTGRRANDAMYPVIDRVHEMAREKGCTPGQLALAWCMHQPGITAPICGPRTLEQLEDNLGALSVHVSDADRVRLDEVAPPRSVTVTYYDNAAGASFGPRQHRW
jgi:aryl-alcohol dehydrogenase-like predicted oxidoreductase